MSANKLLQSLSEDPQLEKQIGCMAGILQLFDRHQVLTGRRLYGHKRISAAAPKTLTSPSSNCGSPASEMSGTSSENMLRHPSDNQKLKHGSPSGAAGSIAASPEQQRSQTLPSPSTPTELKSSSVYARTPAPLGDTSPNGSSRDQLPKISFDMARSSILTPRRLDSSRSLHEGRVNASHEGKVFARRSVDTAERAAAAARGALKELSRISTDFTGGPSHHADQVSIREIVRSSFSKGQQVPNSTLNASFSGSSGTTHTAFAPRMSNEGSIYAQKPGFAKDMSRAQFLEAKSSAESNSAEKTMESSNAFVSQATRRVEASRPPRPCKPRSETPTQSRADISESLRLLAKLREAAPAYNSLLGGNPSADNVGNKGQFSAHYAPRPVPGNAEGPIAYASRAPLPRASDRVPDRMSCSYEPSRSSSVDVLLQGSSKAREFPRLSLDGRGSGAGFKADREAGTHGRPQYSRSLLNSRSVSCSNSDCDAESLHEKRASFSSNVVAKLMGLDEMPNGEPAEAAQLPNTYGPSDQKAQRTLNMAVQDTNPTFSQCGKYVSASFFPSKRRDDIKIAMDLEEEEEDSYLQMDPLSHQEARTLSVKVGSSNLQAGQQRLATTESTHMGHPCYQPKNHHFIEDRPPHVLSPAARLCAQIEEMQRADSLHKGVDRGFRTMEMQQSTSQQDLEALKQLLGAIHLNKGYSNNVGSRLEDMEARGTSGKQQLENGRLSYPHEEQLPPPAIIWKTKRMMNDELYAHTHYQIPNGRKISVESHNRKVRHSVQDPEPLPISRHHPSAQTYNQATRTRAEMQSTSPAASHPSTYSTPRKTNVSNDFITPISTSNANTANLAYRSTSRTNSPSSFTSPRFSPSPQSPFSQPLRQSYYSNSSWEGSSVSSTSSAPARDQHPLRNGDHRAAAKKSKQFDRVERKKVSSSILKDKEECKGNLVSLKPSPNTHAEKRSNSGVVGLRSSARTARRGTPLQNPDHIRSSMRSPTKSSARKADGVKRKLNFVNRSLGRIRPVITDNKDQDTEFVDKTVVSSIDNNILSKQHHAQVHQSSENVSETGHDDEEPLSTQLSNTSSNILPMETEVEVKSPLLLLPCAHGETNHEGQQVITSICNRDPREHITEDVGSPATPMRSPASALKLPQVPLHENEDTESQGDKSTGSCEQPSPISVLEGPFYEEDVSSPPASTKFCLKLEEMEEEEASGKDVKEECEGSPQLSECRSPCRNHSAVDFDYVKQLLDMTSTTMDIDDKKQSTGMVKLRPLESYLFLQLEEENLNSASDSKTELGSMWRRRLLFDGVNASLERRLRRWRLCQRQPWLLACETGLHAIMAEDSSPALLQGMIGLDEEKNVCLSREGRRVLLEEVWEEVGEMHGEQRRKRRKRMCTQQSMGTGACLEEEGEEEAEDGTCDDMGRMLEEDIFGGPFHTRRPDTWASLHVEKGELGLDLERLIFKDLIDHTIRDLGLLILPTTKRQLFKPHT